MRRSARLIPGKAARRLPVSPIRVVPRTKTVEPEGYRPLTGRAARLNRAEATTPDQAVELIQQKMQFYRRLLLRIIERGRFRAKICPRSFEVCSEYIRRGYDAILNQNTHKDALFAIARTPVEVFL